MPDNQAVPQPIAADSVSPEDLAHLMMMSGLAPMPNKGALRRKLLVAVLIAAVGIGASIMSCVGQSFSLRQARAQEGIEQQLREIRAKCSVTPKVESPR
jgi:hypothetical protein